MGRLDAESIARIADLRARTDPVIALASIRAAQAELGRRLDRRGVAPVTRPAPIVVDLAASVSRAERTDERRAIHRRPYRRVKPIPKRPSMLDPQRAEIEAWLETQPQMTAVAVLKRLKACHPDRSANLHLRTAQRMAKAWRAEKATRMIHLGTTALMLPLGQEALILAPPRAATPGNIPG